MMKRLVMLVALVAPMAGCTSLRGEADTAFAHGDFAGAAALYDRVLAGEPGDAAARSRRDMARTRVLRGLLVEAETQRAAGHGDVAATRLAAALDQRDAWAIATPSAIAPQLARVAATIGDDLTAAVATRTRDVGPLAGEAVVTRYAHLLARAELGARDAEVRATTREAGLATCAALTPTATTPYWSWTVDRYCAHFGGPRVAVPAPLPNLVGEVATEGAVTGASAAMTEVLHAEVTRALRASAWFAPAAPATHATISGSVAATFAAAPKTIARDWTESVAYTDYETTQEAYQESYTDTETTYDQVMHTDGDGNTTFETVPRTESVTRYRTAYRDVQTPVTRYRDEARVFTFAAIERTGRYASDLVVRVDRPAVTATLARSRTEQGLDHDVAFAPAGVAPEHVQLTPLPAFAAREADALRGELGRRLDAAYAASFCVAPTYDLEAAAACAYLDVATAPTAVHVALAQPFGGDEAFLTAALAR